MSGYSEDGLRERLRSVHSAEKDIERLSQWIIFNREYASEVVSTWLKEFYPVSQTASLRYYTLQIMCFS